MMVTSESVLEVGRIYRATGISSADFYIHLKDGERRLDAFQVLRQATRDEWLDYLKNMNGDPWDGHRYFYEISVD